MFIGYVSKMLLDCERSQTGKLVSYLQLLKYTLPISVNRFETPVCVPDFCAEITK